MNSQKSTLYAVVNLRSQTYQAHVYPSEARKLKESNPKDTLVLTMKDFYGNGYLNDNKFKKVIF